MTHEPKLTIVDLLRMSGAENIEIEFKKIEMRMDEHKIDELVKQLSDEELSSSSKPGQNSPPRD